MEDIFVTNLEAYEELEIEYDLQDNGMSGDHIGWHWYSDDKAGVNVYLKIEQEA